MKEITPKISRAYQNARRLLEAFLIEPDSLEITLADALRDTRAELMESEFKREHVVTQGWTVESDGKATFVDVCGKCGMNLDTRHLFKFEQWQQAADKLYREG